MKDVRVDGEGEFRCWNCGNKGLLAKRTFRSKVLVGVGALLTKKKLKCQTCGEFNDTGNAKPFDGPAARKWRKIYDKEQKAKSAATIATEERAASLAAAAFVAELAAAEASQLPPAAPTAPSVASPALDVALPPPPPPPAGTALPASWQPDPSGRYELRYWDSSQFTDHVSNSGVASTDPFV